jgi:hypothetical protein
MKTLQSRAWALAGSNMVMMPGSVCCVPGIPCGIWSLLVLNRSEVSAAFGRVSL